MGLQLILMLFGLYVDVSSADVFNLNATEYEKLPPLFKIDPYESCLNEESGLFCMADFIVVSDTYNPIMEMIREYSRSTIAHFNHTKLRRGVCISKTCKSKFLQFNSTSSEQMVESCLNDTFYDKYGLKTKLIHNYCETSESLRNPQTKYELVDLAMLVVLSVVLFMNFLGTVYETRFAPEKINDSAWARILVYFSIRHNWNRLRASAGKGPEPRINRLKGIGGLRTIAMTLAITSHVFVTATLMIDNPQFVENAFNSLQLLINGSALLQWFFFVSGMLMSYNLMIVSEKHEMNWKMIPMSIVSRLLRLTPTYAMLLLFSVSWLRFLAHGPVKHLAVIEEVNYCRQYWWMHLLYINNHNDESTCIIQSWYLAADTQLYCFGIIVFLICMSPSRRKIVLPLLLIAGVIIPALVTYLYDLDGLMVLTPERVGQLFIVYPTFNYIHRRGYSNIFCYVLGMTMGYLIYYGQQKSFNLDKYKKYRFLFLGTLPLIFAVIWITNILYVEDPRPSIAVRMLMAAFIKPFLGFIFSIVLIGIIFKYDAIIRHTTEWSGWTPLARLSYNAYLIHVTILRLMINDQVTAPHITASFLLERSVVLLFLSFVFSVPLYLMVEQPFGQLTKVLFSSNKPKDEKKDTDVKQVAAEENNKTEVAVV